jgi:hypothetical protein
MPTSVQLNTRISPHIKQQGDAVFSRAGLSSSDVVRGVALPWGGRWRWTQRWPLLP